MNSVLTLLVISLLGFYSPISIGNQTISTTTTSSKPPLAINNSTCENCGLMQFPIAPTVNSPRVGNDLGQLNTSFALNGIFTMKNQYSHILTVSPIQSTLPIIAGYTNSSTVSYTTGSIWEYFQSENNGYNQNISIIGKSISPITISLGLVCNQNFNYSKLSVRCGYEIFQWDNKSSISFNNQTNVISWTVSGSFDIDPIAIDGTATGACASPCVAIDTPLTTSNSNDIIIVYFGGNCGGANPTANTVLDTSGLTWHKRIHLYVTGFAGWIDEWYAIATSPLSGDTIVTTLQHPVPCGNANMAVNIFGVSGGSTSNPFDTNAGLPFTGHCSGGGCGVTVDTVTGVSTTNAHDMLIAGDFNANGAGAFSGGSGFTLIATTPTTGGGETSSQYKVVSATQSGVTVTFAGADSDGFSYGMIVDALQQAANVTLTLIVNPSGSGTIYTNFGSSCHTTTTVTCSIPSSTAIDAFEIPIGVNGWQLWLNTSIDLVRCNIGEGFPTNPPSNDYQHCNFVAFSIFSNGTLQGNYTAGSSSGGIPVNVIYIGIIVAIMTGMGFALMVVTRKRRF